MLLEGTILRGRDFEPVEGRVFIDDDEIVEIEEGAARNDDIICPAFVNAHTHIGDSIAKEAGEGLSVEELVAPPDGLKHQLLADATPEALLEAMEQTIDFMAAGGIAAFLDFREGGVEGVRTLQNAAAGTPVQALALGRESVDAMELGDGFGASGANDDTFTRERQATTEANKLFGIHAGEVDESDINQAMDLDPDFLVHMVHAEGLHLERLADSGTPVVVCPRANVTLDVGMPPVQELLDRTTVALGTDNVMLNEPSMLREMAFLERLADVSSAEVLRMATVNGAEIADLNCGVIEEGKNARLVVFDGDSDNLAGSRDPVRSIVRRAGINDISEVITAR